MNKEQELLGILENIEKAYDPNSPFYKFKYVFYNKINSQYCKPYDFPDELWYNSLTKDPSLMPVLLKGKEIEQRRNEQIETTKKLTLSYNFIQDKIDELKLKKDKICSRIHNLVIVYRRIIKNIYNKYKIHNNNCNNIDEINKLNIEIKNEPLEVSCKKVEIVKYLFELKENLLNLLNNINDELYEHEKKLFIFQNINKFI